MLFRSVIGMWTLSYYAGLTPDAQTIVVVATATLVTAGLYQGVELFKRRYPERYARTAERIRRSQPKRDGWMLVAQRIIDRI